MMVKLLWAMAVIVGLSSASAYAQTSDGQTTRNSTLGDPGPKTQTRIGRAAHRAANIAKTDKQRPGTENGNQPDRAAAGSGAR